MIRQVHETFSRFFKNIADEVTKGLRHTEITCSCEMGSNTKSDMRYTQMLFKDGCFPNALPPLNKYIHMTQEARGRGDRRIYLHFGP